MLQMRLGMPREIDEGHLAAKGQNLHLYQIPLVPSSLLFTNKQGLHWDEASKVPRREDLRM